MILATPKPGKGEELLEFCRNSVEHHKLDEPHCLKWLVSSELNSPENQEPVCFIVQEWTSMEDFQAHGKTEYAKGTREVLGPMVEKMEMKISRLVAGFDGK